MAALGATIHVTLKHIRHNPVVRRAPNTMRCYYLLLVPLLATLAAWIPFTGAENRGQGHICTPDHCREGGTSALSGYPNQTRLSSSELLLTDRFHRIVGAQSSTPPIFLLPGVYTSASPLAALIDEIAGYLTNPLDNLNALNGSASVWLGSASEKTAKSIGSSALQWPLVISPASTPVAFANYVFTGRSTSLSTGTHLMLPPQWESLYLPPSTWARIDTDSGQWVIRDGGVAKRPALPGGGRAASGSRVVSFGSGQSLPVFPRVQTHNSSPPRTDRCATSCGIGGTCLPSTLVNSATTAYSCSCLPGFTGPTCSTCLPNHYGPSCIPCAGGETGCGTCHDGVDGSGGCVSVKGPASESRRDTFVADR